MIRLLGDFDFLSVVLRAMTLGLELLTLGGVAYLLIVAMPAGAGESVLAGCWRWIRWSAASFAIVELCYVAVDSAILMGSSSLRLGDLVGARYFVAGAGAAIAAFAIVVCARGVCARGDCARDGGADVRMPWSPLPRWFCWQWFPPAIRSHAWTIGTCSLL